MSQLKKYKRLKYLGKGSYGAAILVELRSNPSQRFVIKEIVIGHLKPAEQAAAKSEAEVLAQMNHSNITMYIESFVENAKLYIVMENADGGDLSAAVQNRKKDMKYYDEEEVMRIFVQICLALKHVHSGNILHRDLKSQNIFLTQKGVVKLGDFGIAKVLDATDEQARTQIGTPYYLSPEICESKPYGRESDVWSLGVILYELIALEMPFQATSLPALVHRICVAEPNYSVVEKRYSAGLIALTKTMLQKDPQKRPSVSQIVKSDFIKTHISRLLSYTLKVGNGGVVGGNQLPLPLPKPSRNINSLDPDEAERCIESVHGHLRAQESKDVRSQSNREALRIAEREKLRKFRNDMVRARKDSDPDAKCSENSKEDDNRIVYKPAPRVVPAGRDMSPKNGRPLSPKQMPRPHSPSPKVNRPLSPKARDNSPKGPRNVSPKARNLSPVNGRAGPSGGAPSADRALTPRSHAVQREKDRKLAAAAMKQGYYDNAEGDAQQRGYRDARQQQQQQQHHQQHQQQAPAQQVVVAKNNQGSNNEYESAARREFFANRAAAMAVKAKVEAYNRHGGERLSMPLIGGGGAVANSRQGSEADRDSYVQKQASVYEEQSQYEQQQRRYSSYGDDDRSDAELRIAQIKAQKEKEREREMAQKEQQIKQAMEANRDARRSVQGNKSAVAFEIDLGGNTAVSKAPVISRERVRQSLDNVSNNNNSPYSVQSDASSVVAAVAGSVKARSVREDKEGHPSATAAANSESTKSRAKKGWGPPVSSSDIAKGVVRHSEYSTPTSQMFAPDRDASGKGGNAGNASVSSSSVVDRDQYFDDDGSSMAEEGRQQVHHHRDFSRDSIDAMSVATEEDQLVLRRLESKRNSQIEARQQAKEVFKKLREQRRKESELKSRRPSADAKVIVQHSVVSPVKKINPNDGAVRAADASPMQIRLMEVMSQVEIANDSVLKAVSGIGASTTESADESAFRVKNPSAGAASSASQQYRSRANSESTPTTSASQASTPSRKVGGGGAVSSSQQQQYAKDVQRLDGHIPLIAEEEEDDLEYTLDNWLTQQKRGVTQRKKHGHGGLLSADDGGNDDDAALIVVVDAGIIEDSADGYRTQKKYDRMYDSQAKGNSAFEEVQDENIDFYTSDTYVVDSKDHDVDQEETVTMSNGNVVRGKYMGNDVEVVGLQCMLAQALMGDNDED